MLINIVSVLSHLFSSQFALALFQSTFTLAFFTLSRVNEVVVLGIDHVSVSGDVIMVFIKISKTDHSGSGAFAQVKNSNDTALLF